MSLWTLERWGGGSIGTIGWLFDPSGDFVCFTLERMWQNNQRNSSCVPVGDYELESHDWRATQTFALVGGTVDHWEGTDPMRRFACVFHPANRVLQLEGCIAPVTRLAFNNGLFGESSSDALGRLLAKLSQGDTLRVVNASAPGQMTLEL